MKKVSILGANPESLYLAIALLKKGFSVNLFSVYSDQVLLRKSTISPVVFGNALALQREQHLDYWRDRAPRIQKVRFDYGTPDGNHAFGFSANLGSDAQSIENELKTKVWMKLFIQHGGIQINQDIRISDLEEIANDADLTIIATKENQLNEIFEPDMVKLYNKTCQRAYLQLDVRGYLPERTQQEEAIHFSNVTKTGEMLVLPTYKSGYGACHTLLFEAFRGSSMDCFDHIQTSEACIFTAKNIIRRVLPWEYEASKNIELIHENAWSHGKIKPTIRKPFYELSKEKIVIGMGEAVMVNDPLFCQCENTYIKMADIYAKNIEMQAKRKYSKAWIAHVFDKFWQYAKNIEYLANICVFPSQQHVQDILVTSIHNQNVAHDLVNGLDDPSTYVPWMDNSYEAERYLASRETISFTKQIA